MKFKEKINPFSEKLNRIVKKVCDGVEVPIPLEKSNDHQAERLIEQLEIKNYPYPSIDCSHREQLQISEDCVACQQLQYKTYQSRFITLAKEQGYEHINTLKAAFDYNKVLIIQYRLTELDELLDAVYPACIARGTWSDFYIMALQARAFLRFKQRRYEESIRYFKMQIDITGPHEYIYGNMALGYSRLNQNAESARCYAQAILMNQNKPIEQQELSTLLVGLATVLDTPEDSLTVLEAGINLLKNTYDKPHSLIAKTLSSMGDFHLKCQNIIAAEQCYSEALTIFIDTCGNETPLTANALNKHAESLLLLGRPQKAISAFINSLIVWTKVDDQSFDANVVIRIVFALRNMEESKKQKNKITNGLIELENKIANSKVLSNDFDVLSILKIIYEFFIFSNNIPHALRCCQFFINQLISIDEASLEETLLPIKAQFYKESTEVLSIMKTIPLRKRKGSR